MISHTLRQAFYGLFGTALMFFSGINFVENVSSPLWLMEIALGLWMFREYKTCVIEECNDKWFDD